jgi:hypothetical protein
MGDGNGEEKAGCGQTGMSWSGRGRWEGEKAAEPYRH